MKGLSIIMRMAMLVGLAISLGGCEGDTYLKPKSKELNIPESLLLEFVEEALDPSTMGLIYDSKEAALLANRYIGKAGMDQWCGATMDSTIAYTYPDESQTFGYEGSCEWTVVCNALSVPQSLAFSNHLMCDYKAEEIPRLSSTTGLGDWAIQQTTEEGLFEMSGQYIRDGYYKTGIQWDNSYYYKITFVATKLSLQSDLLGIRTGLIPFTGYVKDVTLTGLGPTKEFEGYVEFKVGGEVIVMLEGHSYIK